MSESECEWVEESVWKRVRVTGSKSKCEGVRAIENKGENNNVRKIAT